MGGAGRGGVGGAAGGGGRLHRHNWRRRLSGAGFAEVKAGNSLLVKPVGYVGGRQHKEKLMAYRAAVFSSRSPRHDSGARNKQREAEDVARKDVFPDD